MNILLLTLLISMQGPVSTGTGGIHGRVLSATGNPSANIRPGLSPAGDGGALIGMTQTDSAGLYRIESVPPGRYYIVAGLVNSPTYLPGVTSRNMATAVSLRAGSVVDTPDFRVARQSGGLRVKGRVTRDWLRIQTENELPMPPVLRLTGLVGWVEESRKDSLRKIKVPGTLSVSEALMFCGISAALRTGTSLR